MRPTSSQKAGNFNDSPHAGTTPGGGDETMTFPDKTQIVLLLTALRDIASQVVSVLNALIMILSN